MFFVLCTRSSLLDTSETVETSETALVRQVGNYDEDGEEEEREERFPEFHNVLADTSQYDDEPQVGEHARRCRHEEHLNSHTSQTAIFLQATQFVSCCKIIYETQMNQSRYPVTRAYNRNSIAD